MHIQNIREGFVYLRVPDASGHYTKETIQELNSLRESLERTPYHISDLVKVTIPVSDELASWVRTDDAKMCFTDVSAKSTNSRNLMWSIYAEKCNDVVQIVLFGDRKSVHRGVLQLEVHLKHQKAISGFHEKSAQRIASIQKYETSEKIRFTGDESHIPYMVGKNRSNITRIQKMFPGIEIQVLDPDSNYTRAVVIYGDSQLVLERARAELELKTKKWQTDNSTRKMIL